MHHAVYLLVPVLVMVSILTYALQTNMPEARSTLWEHKQYHTQQGDSWHVYSPQLRKLHPSPSPTPFFLLFYFLFTFAFLSLLFFPFSFFSFLLLLWDSWPFIFYHFVLNFVCKTAEE